MSDQRQDNLAELMETLRKWRDELNLQMHLGKAEVKDLWQETEDKWQHLRSELDNIGDDTGDTAKDVGAAAILVAEEIKQGYERLRKLL